MAEPALLTIRRDWPRPDEAALVALSGVSTGLVADALGRSGALDHRIRPVWDGPSFIGAALPVATAPKDNLALYAALKSARPGDVLMIATGVYEGAAVIGDLLIGLMRNAGIVAVVTDGLVRDVPGIVEVGVPVHARGVSPNSPFKHGPGSVGLGIVLGGVLVQPGDIVTGDSDGIVIVPSGRIADVLASLTTLKAKEADLDALVKSGATLPGWVETILDGECVAYVDDALAFVSS
jgi:4-hydroxy-4-methyl-2-oxoglutarate aldolase